jgi:hypothetical protein
MHLLDGDRTQFEEQALAKHAGGILDTPGIVEIVLQRRELEDAAAAGIDLRQRIIQRAVSLTLNGRARPRSS